MSMCRLKQLLFWIKYEILKTKDEILYTKVCMV